MSDRATCHVAFAVDQKMAMPLGVTIAGVLDHLAADVQATLHVMTVGLSTATRSRLDRVVAKRSDAGRRHSIHVHRVDESDVAHLPLIRHLGIATYLRLLLPSVLPEVQKVVYLDADLLVRADVSELASIDLQGCPVAAVPSLWGERLGDARALQYCVADEELSPDALLFNAGVLVLDLDAWRCEGASRRAMQFIKHHCNSLRNADQDAINAIFADRILPLPPRWNAVAAPGHGVARMPDPVVRRLIEDLRPTAQAPASPVEAIIHFCGRHKPWGNTSLTHAFAKPYRETLRRSEWFSYQEYAFWVLSWYIANVLRAAGSVVGSRLKRVKS